MNEKTGSRKIFDSAEVSKAVGIRAIYLNTFIQRKKYGIEPSARSGEGRGKPRFFSEEDVCGIALVWWLFEGGLRSEAIQNVLNQICRGKKRATANEAALVLRESEADILAIMRQPRIGLSMGQAKSAEQDVILLVSAAEPSFERLTETLGTRILFLVPFETLFKNLKVVVQKYGV